MQELVFVNESGEPVTRTTAIAQGAKHRHSTVIRLVRENIVDLEDFGRVGFEIQPFATPGGTQRREVAVLNEQQATLLLTYMRNNAEVRRFKKRLVRAFYELLSEKRQPAFQVPQTMAEAHAGEVA